MSPTPLDLPADGANRAGVQPRKRPTLKEIAAAAGISVSGVSLALRNDRSIPTNTRAKIQQIARTLGYRPDPELARLMTYLRRHPKDRTGEVIGLLTLHNVKAYWNKNNYFKRLHEATLNRALELGYDMQEFWLSDPALTPRRIQNMLTSRGIRGLIIIDGPKRIDSLDFDFDKFSTVTVGYGIEIPLHRVCQHQYQEMFSLLRQLKKLGYQRPGLVLSNETDERTQFHYCAAFAIFYQDDPHHVPRLIADNITKKTFDKWRSRYVPDVIITSEYAPMFYDWLRQDKERIPEDVGFVSLDVDPIGTPHFSGILQNYERVGAVAVESLASNLNHADLGLPACPNIMLVEGRWHEGSTVRKMK